jgi:O-antigen/teichoic acid export membrane protein
MSRMDKALQMGKTSATGSFHLLIGVVASSIILAVGQIILYSLLLPEEIGLYGVALIPASMITFFRDWGVNSAMIQQIASLRVVGKESEIHDVIVSGTIFELASGAILSLICFALAAPIAIILQRSDAQIFIEIFSVSIFTGAVLAAATSVFVGFERMWLSSSTSILQAVVKIALGPLLVLIGFSVFGAVVAVTASTIAGAIVAFILFYFKLFKPLRKEKNNKMNLGKSIKGMLVYGVPLSVSNLVIGLFPQIVAFMMAIYASNLMMGNYFGALNFTVIVTFVSIPIATALFPAFSKLNPEKEPELLRTVFASSVKYTCLLMVPLAMIMIVLAAPIVNTLFPKDGIFNMLFVVGAVPKFPYAALFLAITSIVNLLPLFGTISLGTFQTGIKQTNQVLKQSILSLAVALPVTYLLIVYLTAIGGESFAIIGGILGILISCIPGPLWGLYWSWKKYKVKADFKSSGKIFAASLIASVAAFVVISFLSLPNFVLLVLGFVAFLLVYLISAPLIGAVNRTDIDNIKSMFSGMGIVSKVIDFPLVVMRKLCREEGYKKSDVQDVTS